MTTFTLSYNRVNFHVCLYIEVSGKRRENDRYTVHMYEYIHISMVRIQLHYILYIVPRAAVANVMSYLGKKDMKPILFLLYWHEGGGYYDYFVMMFLCAAAAKLLWINNRIGHKLYLKSFFLFQTIFVVLY